MEVLLRVVDKINWAEPSKNHQLLKRGDIVTIQKDGHNWAREELTNPEWRIVIMPYLGEELAVEWMEPELTGQMRRRKVAFDFGSPLIDEPFRNYLNDNTRKVSTFTIYHSQPSLLLLRKGKSEIWLP